jgi:hypothetical protein
MEQRGDEPVHTEPRCRFEARAVARTTISRALAWDEDRQSSQARRSLLHHWERSILIGPAAGSTLAEGTAAAP